MTLEDTLKKIEQGRKNDAKAFKTSDPDLCMLCGARGSDKRSLRMEYFYDLKEMVPEMLELSKVKGDGGFYIRTCKWCRGELLGLLRVWRTRCVARRPFDKDHDGYITEAGGEDGSGERNIPVRIDGRIVWHTLEEYETYQRLHG